jgi:hypothetical protein
MAAGARLEGMRRFAERFATRGWPSHFAKSSQMRLQNAPGKQLAI